MSSVCPFLSLAAADVPLLSHALPPPDPELSQPNWKPKCNGFSKQIHKLGFVTGMKCIWVLKNIAKKPPKLSTICVKHFYNTMQHGGKISQVWKELLQDMISLAEL